MNGKALGWQIIVTLPDGRPPLVYNVAIPEEQRAIEAVRDVLEDAKGAVLKVKAELTERVYRALRLQPGQVMSGAHPRRKRAPHRRTP